MSYIAEFVWKPRMSDAARYLYVHRAAEYGRILHGFSAVCMGLEYFSRWYGSELAPDPAAADMTYLVTVFSDDSPQVVSHSLHCVQ